MRGYTLLQLRAFSDAAERARRRDLTDAVVGARMAHPESGPLDKFLKALTHG